MPATRQTVSVTSWTSSPMVAALAGASLLSALIWSVDAGRAGPEVVPSQPSVEAARISLNETADLKTDIRAAVSTFIWAISNRNAEAVWHFASEDQQANLETEFDALRFFIGVHPPLAHARQMRFDGIGIDDDGAHATAYIIDTKGRQWLAWFALAQDPFGDWKIVDCRVRLAPGGLA